MVYDFKKIFLPLLFFGLLVSVGKTQAATSTLLGDIEKQNQAFAGEDGANLSAADPRLVVGKIINVLLGITGTVFLCWGFFGGYLIFTSAGDSEKIEHAKSIIINNVIGIIIVLTSYAIATFINTIWKKAQEDPKADKFDVYITPDIDYYKTNDPLAEDTSLPI